MAFQIKRVYAPAEAADGVRVLVDRLWPRGVSKERARLTEWCKDIAPSASLREWFGHQPEKMNAFAERYRMELELEPAKQQDASRLLEMARTEMGTLLYAAKDPQVNHARILMGWLNMR